MNKFDAKSREVARFSLYPFLKICNKLSAKILLSVSPFWATFFFKCCFSSNLYLSIWCYLFLFEFFVHILLIDSLGCALKSSTPSSPISWVSLYSYSNPWIFISLDSPCRSMITKQSWKPLQAATWRQVACCLLVVFLRDTTWDLSQSQQQPVSHSLDAWQIYPANIGNLSPCLP